MRSFNAGPAPLYGTWVRLPWVLALSSSPAKCPGVPVPADANVSLLVGQGRQKFSHGRIRRLGGNDQRERDDGQQGDRLQILVRIVVEALEPMLVDGHFRGLADEQRQPVGRCDGDAAGADGAAGAGAIFHDHRLPERRSKAWARQCAPPHRRCRRPHRRRSGGPGCSDRSGPMPAAPPRPARPPAPQRARCATSLATSLILPDRRFLARILPGPVLKRWEVRLCAVVRSTKKLQSGPASGRRDVRRRPRPAGPAHRIAAADPPPAAAD